jgi:hypothetical protein
MLTERQCHSFVEHCDLQLSAGQMSVGQMAANQKSLDFILWVDGSNAATFREKNFGKI